MVRKAMLAWLLLCLAGCFGPGPQDLVRQWKPMGASGPTLDQALATSPWRKNTTWESFAGEGGQTLVRLTVEYQPAGAEASCPAPPPGMRRATRLFLVAEFTVSKDAAVEFSGAKAQVYTAKGYFEEYALDRLVMGDLMAGSFPLPCADLDLPDYL